MRWWTWLGVLLVVWLAAGAARAEPELVSRGETVAGWRLLGTTHHPEFLRLFFARGEQRTALEIGRHTGEPGPWATDHHHLMPAPGAAPPAALLSAVMERLRAYDAHGGAPLVSHRRRGQSAPAATSAAGPRGPPPVRVPPWWGIGCALLAIGLVLAGRLPALRASATRLAGLIERQPWPWLAALLTAMAWPRLLSLDNPFVIDAMTQRVLFASLDLRDILLHHYPDQRHPQLYYLLLHALLWLGHSEAITRLPAVLFSLLTAAASFSLSRRALGAGRALLVVALIGLSAAFFEHSREVSDVTLFMFLAVLSTELLLRSLRAPRWAMLLAFAACEVAMLYSYYLATVVVLAHLLVTAATSRGGARRRVLSAIAAALLAALPVGIALFRLVADDRGARHLAHADPAHMWGEQSGLELLRSIGRLLAPNAAMILLLAALTAVGFHQLWRHRERRSLALSGALLVVLPLAALFAGATLVRLKPYYALFALPFAALLLVAACLPPAGPRAEPLLSAASRAAGIALLLLFASAQGLDLRARLPELLHPRFDAPRFDALGRTIKTAAGPRTVIADGNNLHTILLYYAFDDPLPMYRRCRLVDADAGGTECHRGDEHLITLTVLPKLREGWQQRSLARLAHEQLEPSWVVYTGQFSNAPLLDELQRRCILKGRFAPRDGLLLFLCPAR